VCTGRREYVSKVVEPSLHILTAGYMVMRVEVDCLTGLVEVDEAKAKEQNCSAQRD
jgi:hypothetical protein